MDIETLTKIIERKVLFAEIKAEESELERLNKQIEEIEQAKRILSLRVQSKLAQSNSVSDWLLEREYEALKYIEPPEIKDVPRLF